MINENNNNKLDCRENENQKRDMVSYLTECFYRIKVKI